VAQEITQTKPNQTKLENFLSSQRKKERKKGGKCKQTLRVSLKSNSDLE
jgi:hypothetical protein